MTDNGSCYRSRALAQALGENVAHKRTRPYRPQANDKVERFNRTLTIQWAYARTYTSQTKRETAYTQWLHTYNHDRPHTALDGQIPTDRAHNLPRKYNYEW